MIKFTKEINLSGYTFIVPAVAVGNVAQLAVDLLIYNSGMKKIGQLVSSDFIPFLGPDPFDENSTDISTTIDFYVHEKKQIIVLQIRSPPASSLNGFFVNLRDFVKERKISKVIILTGEWQYVRNDCQLRSEATHYVASTSMELGCGEIFQQLGWKKLERTSDRIELSGGGFAPSLYHYLSENEIPCAILLKFCSEGDNIPDAKELARYVNHWISLVRTNKEANNVWKEPPSWKYVFGHEAPSQIF